MKKLALLCLLHIPFSFAQKGEGNFLNEPILVITNADVASLIADQVLEEMMPQPTKLIDKGSVQLNTRDLAHGASMGVLVGLCTQDHKQVMPAMAREIAIDVMYRTVVNECDALGVDYPAWIKDRPTLYMYAQQLCPMIGRHMIGSVYTSLVQFADEARTNFSSRE